MIVTFQSWMENDNHMRL